MKIYLLTFGICFFTALLTKRENIVLLCLFFFISIYKFSTLKRNIFQNLLPLIVSFVILIFYLIFIQNVFLIEKTESAEISTQTFSLSNLINLIPVFIKALANFKWFSIYLLILVISIIFIIYDWKRNPFQLFILVLFLSYFFIYTLHYRSYYYVHYGDIKPFEALRYLNNIFVISTIIISFVLFNLLNISGLKSIIIPILSILLVVSFINTLQLRKEFSEMEKENRFSNPELVLKYLSQKEKPVLIADNILIFQLIGDKNLELVDITTVDNVLDCIKSRNAYIFISNFNKPKNMQYRYPAILQKLQMIKKNEIMLFNNDDSLYKVELQ